jgi:tripartite-type tricarboxylate transporter receptor subunit TctC
MALLIAAGSVGAHAPLRIVVPFAAGGGGDLLARTIAPEVAQALRVPIVIENLPGASGAVGMQRVRNARPDERVVVLASDHASVLAPLVSASAGYDTKKDFRMVGQAASHAYALVLPAGAGSPSLADFRSLLAQPRCEANVAVPAEGGMPEAIFAALAPAGGCGLVLVAYRGGSPAIAALSGGQVAAAAVGVSNALQLHRAGRLRVVAVSGPRRSAALPEVPTFQEQGVPGLAMAAGWAVFAPRTTPLDLVALNAALRQALSRPSVQEKLRALGLEPRPLGIVESQAEYERALEAWKISLGARKP